MYDQQTLLISDGRIELEKIEQQVRPHLPGHTQTHILQLLTGSKLYVYGL